MPRALCQVTTRDLAADRASGTASQRGVILPVGSVEQHGAYLPVTCDVDIAQGVAAALTDALELRGRYRAWMAPPVPYGPVPGASRTDGTSSVGFSEFGDYLSAVASGFAGSGVWDFIVIVNAHAHNHGRAIEAACTVYGRHHVPVFVLQVYEYAHLCAELGIEPGSHGGEFEIALHNYYVGRKPDTGHLPSTADPRPRPLTVFGLDLLPRSYDGIVAATPPSVDRALAAAGALGERLDAELAARLETDLDVYFASWQIQRHDAEGDL